MSSGKPDYTTTCSRYICPITRTCMIILTLLFHRFEKQPEVHVAARLFIVKKLGSFNRNRSEACLLQRSTPNFEQRTAYSLLTHINNVSAYSEECFTMKIYNYWQCLHPTKIRKTVLICKESLLFLLKENFITIKSFKGMRNESHCLLPRR